LTSKSFVSVSFRFPEHLVREWVRGCRYEPPALLARFVAEPHLPQGGSVYYDGRDVVVGIKTKGMNKKREVALNRSSRCGPLATTSSIATRFAASELPSFDARPHCAEGVPWLRPHCANSAAAGRADGQRNADTDRHTNRQMITWRASIRRSWTTTSLRRTCNCCRS
jgi:hypothetical protein